MFMVKPVRGVFLAVALLLAACGEGEGKGIAKGYESWLGRDVSGLVVETLDGDVQPLRDVLMEGKPVVLNVWATWCPPCLKEMPTLDALGKQGHYTVVAIATDAEAETVKEFLKRQTWGAGVRVWFDPHGKITREALGAGAIPVTYVLDKDLKVVDVQAGAHDWVERLGIRN